MIHLSPKSLSLCLALLCVSTTGLHAQNLVVNGDFEVGTRGWAPFIPDESKPNDCKLEVSTDNPHEGQSLRMSCNAVSRFAATTVIKGEECIPGDRYRISLWARAGDDFVPSTGTPGFMVRVGFFSDPATWASAPGGHFHLVMGNAAAMGSTPPQTEELPKKWTKLEGVFEIPPETVFMNIALFIAKGTGSVYVDDVAIEKADKSTPLSTLSH